MGFNNQPEEGEDYAPISTWYIDQEEWEAVRTGHAAEMVPCACGASISDGYVTSLNYACEVLARQREGWA